MTREIETIVDIAREAGGAVMGIYGRQEGYETKADGSPLTEADRLSHRIIVDELQGAFPQVPVLSEEGTGVPYEERRRWRRFWLVDPLDGTKEFIKRNGEFTINIALVKAGRPVLGVIYAPALGILYYGEIGQGAFKVDGTVGSPALAVQANTKRAETVRVVGSRSHSSPEEDEFVSQFDQCERIAIGSSLKFCMVAEGAADIYYRHGHTWEWDTAAGQAIAEAAGALLYGLRYGKENMLNDSFLCVSKGMETHGFTFPPGVARGFGPRRRGLHRFGG